MEKSLNAYSNVKSCNCEKEFCDYTLLVTVSRLGNEPDISTEMSCNKTLLLANKDQIEEGGWARGMIYQTANIIKSYEGRDDYRNKNALNDFQRG